MNNDIFLNEQMWPYKLFLPLPIVTLFNDDFYSKKLSKVDDDLVRILVGLYSTLFVLWLIMIIMHVFVVEKSLELTYYCYMFSPKENLLTLV